MGGGMTDTTVVSAPGKVLVAGGYVVLDRQYTGLVVATSSRFYTCVRSLVPSQVSKPSKGITITIQAGQFPAEQSTWVYSVDLSEAQVVVRQTNEVQAGRNKFVHLTLEAVVRYAVETLEKSAPHGSGTSLLVQRLEGGLDISVWADNDFYSQREQLAAKKLPLKRSALSSLPPFCALPRPIPQTNKTGLGSSAALVTSLVAGLLQHLGLVSLPDVEHSLHNTSTSSSSAASSFDLDRIHALAQYAHCLAQGKVGSGFDVSSATYGSHIYRRFPPSILAPLLDNASSSEETVALLQHLNPSKWDAEITPFRLPKGVRLLLADVDAGTDTPSFVGKVLKWRTENPDKAKEVWDQLDEANVRVGDQLNRLRRLEAEDGYLKALAAAAQWQLSELPKAPQQSLPANSQRVFPVLAAITSALNSIRSLMRLMSSLSGVPIEPPEQTRLLDACSALPGVLGGGVPGAGGFDAVFLLVLDGGNPSRTDKEESDLSAEEEVGAGESEVVRRVEEVWAGWKEMSVCPLMAAESEGGGGLRKEVLQRVPGLQDAMQRH